ncbi:MAG: hypothetical protein VW378_02365 [bacterium]
MDSIERSIETTPPSPLSPLAKGEDLPSQATSSALSPSIKTDPTDMGEIFHENGSVYEGPLSNDLPHGEGKLIYPGVSTLEGVFSNGHLVNSYGKISYQEKGDYPGASYLGKVNNRCQPQGPGTMIFKEGLVLRGNFDKVHQCVVKYNGASGAYTGSIDKRGYPYNGSGMFMDNAGNVFEGVFIDGKYHKEDTLSRQEPHSPPATTRLAGVTYDSLSDISSTVALVQNIHHQVQTLIDFPDGAGYKDSAGVLQALLHDSNPFLNVLFSDHETVNHSFPIGTLRSYLLHPAPPKRALAIQNLSRLCINQFAHYERSDPSSPESAIRRYALMKISGLLFQMAMCCSTEDSIPDDFKKALLLDVQSLFFNHVATFADSGLASGSPIPDLIERHTGIPDIGLELQAVRMYMSDMSASSASSELAPSSEHYNVLPKEYGQYFCVETFPVEHPSDDLSDISLLSPYSASDLNFHLFPSDRSVPTVRIRGAYTHRLALYPRRYSALPAVRLDTASSVEDDTADLSAALPAQAPSSQSVMGPSLPNQTFGPHVPHVSSETRISLGSDPRNDPTIRANAVYAIYDTTAPPVDAASSPPDTADLFRPLAAATEKRSTFEETLHRFIASLPPKFQKQAADWYSRKSRFDSTTPHSDPLRLLENILTDMFNSSNIISDHGAGKFHRVFFDTKEHTWKMTIILPDGDHATSLLSECDQDLSQSHSEQAIFDAMVAGLGQDGDDPFADDPFANVSPDDLIKLLKSSFHCSYSGSLSDVDDPIYQEFKKFEPAYLTNPDPRVTNQNLTHFRRQICILLERKDPDRYTGLTSLFNDLGKYGGYTFDEHQFHNGKWKDSTYAEACGDFLTALSHREGSNTDLSRLSPEYIPAYHQLMQRFTPGDRKWILLQPTTITNLIEALNSGYDIDFLEGHLRQLLCDPATSAAAGSSGTTIAPADSQPAIPAIKPSSTLMACLPSRVTPQNSSGKKEIVLNFDSVDTLNQCAALLYPLGVQNRHLGVKQAIPGTTKLVLTDYNIVALQPHLAQLRAQGAQIIADAVQTWIDDTAAASAVAAGSPVPLPAVRGIAASGYLHHLQQQHFRQDPHIGLDMQHVAHDTIAFNEENHATGVLSNTARAPFKAKVPYHGPEQEKEFPSAEHYFHYMKLAYIEQNSTHGLLHGNDPQTKEYWLKRMLPLQGSQLQDQCDDWGFNDAFKSPGVPEWHDEGKKKVMWDALCLKYQAPHNQEFRKMINEIARCDVKVWEWRNHDQKWGRTATNGGSNLAGCLLTGLAWSLKLQTNRSDYDSNRTYVLPDYDPTLVPSGI